MKPTIAYVDDDFENLIFYKEMLSEYFNVEIFSRSLDLTTAMKVQTFDCFLLDIYMPHIDGFTLLEQIREKSEYSSTPILFITSNPHDEVKILSYKNGATDFIDRMVKKDELIARLESKIKAAREHINYLKMGNLSIDHHLIDCSLNGERIILTLIEFKILSKLMKSYPHKILKEELVSYIWGSDQLSANTLHTHLYNLRVKVGGWSYMIENHRLQGFYLKPF